MTSKQSLSVGKSLLFLATLALSLPSNAQVSGGTLLGTVKDKSGAIVANAQLTVTNSSTSVKRTVKTNQDGIYRAPNLIPGEYEVAASAPSFSTSVVKHLQLDVGAELVLDFELKVGSASESVEVAADAAEIERSTSTMSGVINDKTIRELPL